HQAQHQRLADQRTGARHRARGVGRLDGMARFIAGRGLQAIPTLFIISIVVFTLMRLAPGDPAVLRFGSQASLPENQPRIEALRRDMGLDRPILVQYAIWLKDAAVGNFVNLLKSNM